MKKVLYISNISVPYRTAFFEELGKLCELTVLYERQKSNNRNADWANVQGKNYKIHYLNGIEIGPENSFSFNILKYLVKTYDEIIIGCYNSPVEILAILYMRITHRKYCLNIDGEIFEPRNPIKKWIRNFVLQGANTYFSAGVSAVSHIQSVAKSNNVVPYYFSSLTKEETKQANKKTMQREKTILSVGQYEDYKGLDVLLDAAKKLPQYHFEIVGMGKKKDAFLKLVKQKQVGNVTVIGFLKKDELAVEYQKAAILVLPSRQECWGLVVNEGAAYGIRIVSTEGSGAAVEFLSNNYKKYLAKSGDVEDLVKKIKALAEAPHTDKEQYSSYLKSKSLEYTVERMVEVHWGVINK